jgi:integrase
MASVYKPTYLQAIPLDAIRSKSKGGLAQVRFIDGKGKAQVRPIHLDANGNETDKMVCQQSHWWMKYTLPDGTVRREKGYRDKLATEQEAARREREAQQAAAGLQLVDSRHLSAPLLDHVAAFVADKERAGRARKHYEIVDTRLRNIVQGCEWGTLRQISSDSLVRYLSGLKAKGRTGKTQNEYLAAAKSFCNWCIRNRRLAGNPLESVAKVQNVQPTYIRRALTQDEAKRLLAVAGPRKLVYLTAMYTGLRREELRQLQWGDVRIGPDDKTPCIVLRAWTTKSRRADTVPLREDMAAALRKNMPPEASRIDLVFPRVPKMPRFKKDLKSAGIPHADAGGRVVDFHALSVSYGTMLAKSGAAPRVAMELMRHTDIRLTMGVYTDPRILDTAQAVNNLPCLDDAPQVNKNRGIALRTGTDGMPVQTPNLTIALNRGSECPRGSISVRLGESEHKKTPDFSGVLVGAEGFEPSTS